MGDFLDDTSLNLLDMKLVKAFLDVGLYESMAWARWGASKWAQNEPRAVADNTHDGDVQLPPDFVHQIKFIDFFNMVRPAFKDPATRAHMDAVFKRASSFLNSCTHLYFRAAGINDNHVHRLPMPSQGFLTEAGRKLYGEYKAGNKEPPSGLEEEIRKEQEWISIIMNKKIEERKKNKQKEETRLRIRQALFQENTPEPESAIATLEAERAQSAHIKREREEEEEKTQSSKKQRHGVSNWLLAMYALIWTPMMTMTSPKQVILEEPPFQKLLKIQSGQLMMLMKMLSAMAVGSGLTWRSEQRKSHAKLQEPNFEDKRSLQLKKLAKNDCK